MSNLYANFWDSDVIATGDLDFVMNYICTGKKAKEARAEDFIFPAFGKRSQQITMLDFGCGVGRNTFALAEYSLIWTVYGYDSEPMINRAKEYCELIYGMPTIEIPNVILSSDWRKISSKKYDVIYASLVFQHIHEQYLRSYLNDMRSMTKKLIVHGREFNDDQQKSTWKIMENEGYFPYLTMGFDPNLKCVIKEYKAEEHPEAHSINFYVL